MSWSSLDLREDLKVLDELYNKETSTKEKEHILKVKNSLIKTIAELELGDINYKYGSNIWALIRDVPSFQMYYPTVKEFVKTLENNPRGIKIPRLPNKSSYKLPLEDICDLVYDYYKSMPKSMSNRFEKIQKDNRTFITLEPTIESHEGITYHIPILDKRYVSIGSKGDSRELLNSLTHEFGHIITCNINGNRYISDDFFTEIESIFFELLGLDYYYNKTGDKFYLKRMNYKIDYFYEQAMEMIKYENVYNKVFNGMTDGESAQSICDETLKKEGFRPKRLNIETDEIMLYLFGYICAIELFETYKEDPEKGLDLYRKIIKKKKNQTEYDSIYDNITPVKSLNKHIKRLGEM